MFDHRYQELGVEHRLTRSYTPKTNGLVERFNGRIAELLKQHYFTDYNKLMYKLNEYI
ncbi:MAG: integrase core domain-containing protein [Candidatus Hydrogenedens sp.]